MLTPKGHAIPFLLLGIALSCIVVSQSKAEGLIQQAHYDTVAARSGESCAVCGNPVSDTDVALMVKGRRVPLKREMMDEFIKHQEKYFARLQPKGALFQEEIGPESGGRSGVSMGWFLFGVYVLIALLFAGLSGYAAIGKGLKPIPGFFLGLVFTVFGYFYVLSRPRAEGLGEIPSGLVKVPDTSAPIPCKVCGNTNHPSAGRCSACHAELKPTGESEVSRAMGS